MTTNRASICGHSTGRGVVADPEPGGGAVHLLSLVGPSTVLIVMDRALTRDVWNGA